MIYRKKKKTIKRGCKPIIKSYETSTHDNTCLHSVSSFLFFFFVLSACDSANLFLLFSELQSFFNVFIMIYGGVGLNENKHNNIRSDCG